MAALDDLLAGYKFWVELDSDLVAGFTECSGIQAEAEIQEWLEGGENTMVHKIPGRTKYGNITLKHGFTESEALWTWFTKVLKGDLNLHSNWINVSHLQNLSTRRYYDPGAHQTLSDDAIVTGTNCCVGLNDPCLLFGGISSA